MPLYIVAKVLTQTKFMIISKSDIFLLSKFFGDRRSTLILRQSSLVFFCLTDFIVVCILLLSLLLSLNDFYHYSKLFIHSLFQVDKNIQQNICLW